MTHRQPGSRRESPTDTMVAALLQHDRRLEIASAEADRYEQLARAATRFKKVPEGTRVRVERRWQEGKAWVVLEDLPAWMTVELTAVAVPSALRDPTDVVVQLRDREDFNIRRDERNRALRLIEALVREARLRGYTVRTTPAPRKDRWGYYNHSDGDCGHIVITLGPDHYQLSITQEREKVAHTPTKAEQAQAARGYSYITKFDTVLSPHLRLTIEGHEAPFRRPFWSDKQHGPLESALAQILQELELRHERAEQQRRDTVRQQEERQRRWHEARAAAVEQLAETHRAQTLAVQIEAWELAARIRAYADAMESRLDDRDDPEQRTKAMEWIEWAREYAHRTDPLNSPLRLPDPPRATAETLAPFMKGWSPHGLT